MKGIKNVGSIVHTWSNIGGFTGNGVLEVLAGISESHVGQGALAVTYYSSSSASDLTMSPAVEHRGLVRHNASGHRQRTKETIGPVEFFNG